MNPDQPIVSDDELFKRVNLGNEAEKFLRHNPQGRLLSERARHEWLEAVYAFEGLDIETILQNPDKVAAIHYKMQVARAFMVWMNENIVSAKRAEKELHNRDMSDETID